MRHISVSNWVFLTIRPLPYISTKSLIDPPPWYIRMCPIKGGSPDVLTQWERGGGGGRGSRSNNENQYANITKDIMHTNIKAKKPSLSHLCIPPGLFVYSVYINAHKF